MVRETTKIYEKVDKDIRQGELPDITEFWVRYLTKG
jgi:hypothetical protein